MTYRYLNILCYRFSWKSRLFSFLGELYCWDWRKWNLLISCNTRPHVIFENLASKHHKWHDSIFFIAESLRMFLCRQMYTCIDILRFRLLVIRKMTVLKTSGGKRRTSVLSRILTTCFTIVTVSAGITSVSLVATCTVTSGRHLGWFTGGSIEVICRYLSTFVWEKNSYTYTDFTMAGEIWEHFWNFCLTTTVSISIREPFSFTICTLDFCFLVKVPMETHQLDKDHISCHLSSHWSW